MDIQLDTIVEQFKARLDELVPVGSRLKSISLTNLETAHLFAEKARNEAGGKSRLHLYGNPEAVGWLGYIESDQGRGVEYWITLKGEVIPNTHTLDPDTLPGVALEAAPPA